MDDERYKKAKKRVAKLRSFYSNLITFILVNVLLIIINLIADPHSLWFYWVTLIWGIILIVQAFNTFTIRDSFLGEEWERKKVEKMLKDDDEEDDDEEE
ncbi:MAG: 2TM domain-containing protein [Chlamydiales bacterium]|nr:2TM domain-containing protein [Chlamydiales bacterium]